MANLKMMVALVLCMVCTTVYGQDVIVKKDGEQLIGKIVKIESDAVHYRYFNDVEGPTLHVPRQEVSQVKLSASVDPVIYSSHTYTDEITSITEAAELRLQAKRDANSYYKARGVFWTTLGSTVLYPVAGVVTGTVVSVLPPNIDADYNPNRHLMKDPVYREAYQKQAKKRKFGNAAAGFSAGAAILGAVYIFMVSSALGGG